MAKRVVWKEKHIVNVKLRDNLFTLGQMCKSPVMCFFDVRSSTALWKDINLNQVDKLFSVTVGQVINKNLIHNIVKEKTVTPADNCFDPYWIQPHINFKDGFIFLGGKLIDWSKPEFFGNVTNVPTIKANLTVDHDRELIERYELTSMWGEYDLSDRLCRYFDTGINRDDLKFEVFPDLWDDRDSLRPLTRRLPIPLR